MSQTPIPALFMRGGTSRGPFFNRADLPEDLDRLAEILVAVTGSGHPVNIDGLGGGVAVTTKVAMISPSKDDWAEIDYFFAQVTVDTREVDYGPTCGNMLSGIAPAAIEMGMIRPTGPETTVKIRAVNTGALVEARVQTPEGRVRYDGDARIDGVPGTAAPIILNFRGAVGSKTGALLPTGNAIEEIAGIPLTMIDCAMPLAIARAEDLGLTGHESREELEANRGFFERMEPIRIEAGRRMGLGDVSRSVVPKFAVLAPARQGGAVAARYFMPWQTHPSMAVTGGICIGTCLAAPGTVAEGVAVLPSGNPRVLGIEHPMGQIDISLDAEVGPDGLDVRSAGVLRTARLLMRGEVMVPAGIGGL